LARLERFHVGWKQKPLQHFCVVEFSDAACAMKMPAKKTALARVNDLGIGEQELSSEQQ
jgi:hypothetical protein